jgi:beta-galactosidase GanA
MVVVMAVVQKKIVKEKSRNIQLVLVQKALQVTVYVQEGKKQTPECCAYFFRGTVDWAESSISFDYEEILPQSNQYTPGWSKSGIVAGQLSQRTEGDCLVRDFKRYPAH